MLLLLLSFVLPLLCKISPYLAIYSIICYHISTFEERGKALGPKSPYTENPLEIHWLHMSSAEALDSL